MPLVECPYEQDVMDAVATGRWPGRSPAELRDHVAGCGACADLLEVLPAIAGAWEPGPAEAQVPSSAVVWWRAQIRAREEAAAVAAKPLTVVQALAGVIGLALGAAAFAALYPWMASAFVGLRAAAAGLMSIDLPRLAAIPQTWILAAAAAGAALLLTMLAVFAAVVED